MSRPMPGEFVIITDPEHQCYQRGGEIVEANYSVKNTTVVYEVLVPRRRWKLHREQFELAAVYRILTVDEHKGRTFIDHLGICTEDDAFEAMHKHHKRLKPLNEDQYLLLEFMPSLYHGWEEGLILT